ncbi:transposase [Oceaniserpentilla sp. 4NH20-0058]|uniref:REP-associated tyrosine transposase n=1 Tax=Oceaniserpentilla sp. 4NH20-0058 TaxID=3127660 RepID=UPI00310C13C2
MSWNDLRKGRVSEPNREYFITFTCNDRKPLFSNHQLAHAFCKMINLNELQCDCLWATWVLMPNHFHGLLQLQKNNLAQVVGKLKGASARKINQHLQISGPVWQPSFYDRALRTEDNRKDIARYIIANPLRANLVASIKDYPYWNSIYLPA